MYKRLFKRLIDFSIAFISLVIASPLLIFLIVIIYLTNQGAGIFFTQRRPGTNEKIFKVIKFKTMTDDKDNKGNLLPEAFRITRLGHFLRNTSLDEIPQLINVLKGDMSLIGPRPLLIEYLPLYNEHQKRRHEVRPGITGWALVNGRNAISWNQKFDYDVWYVDNLSFMLDLKIIYMTILKVFKSEGIYQSEEEIVMEAFKGSK